MYFNSVRRTAAYSKFLMPFGTSGTTGKIYAFLSYADAHHSSYKAVQVKITKT
jgi:hypothetical protein